MSAARCLLLCAPLMLAACAGSLFKSKVAPPTMYMLSAPRAPAVAAPGDSPAATPPAGNAGLAILRPRVRAGLDTERIAALYPDRHLDYFADSRWSGPLEEVVQDLAVETFRSQPALANVSADASAFSSAYWLELDVADFQAEYSAPGAPPQVHVRLLARLGHSIDRRNIANFQADEHEAASEDRMSAIVEAYNRAVGEALAAIAAEAMATLREQ